MTAHHSNDQHRVSVLPRRGCFSALALFVLVILWSLLGGDSFARDTAHDVHHRSNPQHNEPSVLPSHEVGEPLLLAHMIVVSVPRSDGVFVLSAAEQRSVLSFARAGFRVMLWCREPSAQLVDYILRVGTLEFVCRSLHGAIGHTNNNSAISPLHDDAVRLLAVFGGWYFVVGSVCVKRAVDFAELVTTTHAPLVVTHAFRSASLSLDVLFFTNRSIATYFSDALGRAVSLQPFAAPVTARDLKQYFNVEQWVVARSLLQFSEGYGTRVVTRVVPDHVFVVAPMWASQAQINDSAVSQASPHEPRNSVVDNRNSTVANFLWFGATLTPMAFCCIASFVAHGWTVVVWTYEERLVVPDGASLGNATRIFPQSYRYTITQNGVKGSMSGFSNMFRYRLLATYGGWWFDTDLFCTRVVGEFVELISSTKAPVVVGFEDARITNGAVMYFGDRSLPLLAESRANERLDALNRSVPWGTLGPKLVSAILKERRLVKYGRPEYMFYPIHFDDWRLLFERKSRQAAADMVRCAFTVHLWNELSKKKVPKTGSWIWQQQRDLQCIAGP